MLQKFAALALLLVGFPLTIGCNCEHAELTPELSSHRQRLLLEAEPAGAVGVIDAREMLSQSDQPIVLVGRIGGNKPVFSAGKASFFLVDPAAVAEHTHADGCSDNCPFCSKGADDSAVAMIHCVDADGKALPLSADQLLDLAEGQMAVIQGRAHVDEFGNLIVLADGVYKRG